MAFRGTVLQGSGGGGGARPTASRTPALGRDRESRNASSAARASSGHRPGASKVERKMNAQRRSQDPVRTGGVPRAGGPGPGGRSNGKRGAVPHGSSAAQADADMEELSQQFAGVGTPTQKGKSPPVSPTTPRRPTPPPTVSSGSADPADPSIAKEQTLIILDWDDTLLPTQLSVYFMDDRRTVNAQAPLPKPLLSELELLQNDVTALLDACIERAARVVIVTNGQLGWVETSAKRFMPRVLGYLKKHNITIISAQFTFRKQKQIRADDPQSWKDSAFEQLVREGVKKPVHLISLGDSVYERKAAQGLTDHPNVGLTKTIKFVDSTPPTIAQLRGQQLSVTAALDTICKATHSLDVDLDLEM